MSFNPENWNPEWAQNMQAKECVKTHSWLDQAKEFIAQCSYPDYTFNISESRTGAVYLQATYLEADTVTGKVEEQFTRRWFLSPSMGKSEIVATAFKCILTSMEHRTREWFLYRGKAIYQPHYDVDSLHAICEQREVRTAAEV